MAIDTYERSARRRECIEILVAAGGSTRYVEPPDGDPVLLHLLTGRMDQLTQRIDADPALVHRCFAGFDFGATGMRWLTLKGATLLHVAAEYGDADAVRLLLRRGADVNARATIHADLNGNPGVGGQTPIFHAASQFNDWGLAAAQALIDAGADLSIRVRIPGHYDRPGEIVACTPLEYARLFPGDAASKTVAILSA